MRVNILLYTSSDCMLYRHVNVTMSNVSTVSAQRRGWKQQNGLPSCSTCIKGNSLLFSENKWPRWHNGVVNIRLHMGSRQPGTTCSIDLQQLKVTIEREAYNSRWKVCSPNNGQLSR